MNFAAIKQLVGPDLVAYCLAIGTDELDRVIAGERPPTGAQEQALSALDAIVTRYAMYPVEIAAALVTHDTTRQTSVANVLREACGGSVDQPHSDDPLLRALLTVAKDVFPALLAPIRPRLFDPVGRGPRGFGDALSDWEQGCTRALYRHPIAENDLPELVRQDPTLQPIFARYEPEPPFVMLSTGTGSQLPAESLGRGVIEATVLRVAHERGDISVTRFLELVRDTLEKTRALLSGETIDLELLMGWASFPLGASATVATPWGAVVAASERQKGLQPFGVQADAVLHLPVRASARLGPHDPAHDGGWLLESAALIGRAQQLLPFAFLLAMGRRGNVPYVAWTTTPFQIGGGKSFSGALPPRFPPSGGPQLEPEEVDSLRRWTEAVDRYYDDAIAITVRRLVSAATEQMDPADSLIDAVMVWENLLGATPETAFRITASMTHLLEPDSSKRAPLQKRLNKVYAARSKIVHGQTATPDAGKHEQAIDFAIAALRGLFERFPTLINSRSSSERASALLLGHASPIEPGAEERENA